MALAWHNQKVTPSVEGISGPVLALDYGKRRIGLAVSSNLGARPLDVLKRKGLYEDLLRLEQLVQEHQVTLIVVGLPLHMSGDESSLAKDARAFAGRVAKATRLPVYLHDERLTSEEAESILREKGWNLQRFLEEKKNGAVDRLAATILLEDWLGSAQPFARPCSALTSAAGSAERAGEAEQPGSATTNTGSRVSTISHKD